MFITPNMTSDGHDTSVTVAGVQLSFRSVGDRRPDTLEIALHGRRRPRVEAYWDGCLMAMG